jgi:DinB superfamily
MTIDNVERIFASTSAATTNFAARAAALTPEELNFKPDAEIWSPAEIIEHVAIVNRNILVLAGRLVDKATAEGHAAKPGPIPTLGLLDILRDSKGAKLKAPERIQPTGKFSVAESIQLIEQSSAQLRELQPRVAELDGAAVTFDHPVFGPLNLYEWIVLIGLHQNRHLQQIEERLGQKN